MRALPLLFDPRGAIDRRTYWSGLIQLTLVSLAVGFGLLRLDSEVGVAAFPAFGEAFLVTGMAGSVYDAGVPDVAFLVSIPLIAARLYASVCLLLKRSRDVGKGLGGLTACGMATVFVHGLMGLWAYAIFDEGEAVILPLAIDAIVAATVGLAFVAWLGVQRSAHAVTPGPAR